MGDGIVFALKDNGVSIDIAETGNGREAAHYFSGQTAHATANRDFLNAEHAEGRVAQGRCVIGSSMVEVDAKPIDVGDAKPGKKGKAKEPDKILVRRGGLECDRDRIVDPRLLTSVQRASIVLCREHADEVGAARASVAG